MLEDDFSGLGSLTQVRTYALCRQMWSFPLFGFLSVSIIFHPQASQKNMTNFVMFKTGFSDMGVS